MPTYSIDTRTMAQGDYFVAVEGERHDGHDFAGEALEKGAGGLVIERPLREVIDDGRVPSGVEVAVVEDSERYLAEQAQQRLREWDTDVVAITGSVGKTTTRGAVTTVLRESFPVVATRGNYNTMLGIGLTVLNHLDRSDQKLIVEMGAYHRGSIARLCRYYRPTVSIVTTVRPVHLDRMGSIENIALAKREIVEAVPPDGAACLNWDDERVRAMADACKGEVLSYGVDHPEAEFRPDRLQVEIPLLGSHAAYVALSAFCVGHRLGMSDEAIGRGITKLEAQEGRLRRLPGRNGSILIDDTYNAAEASTLVALDALANLNEEGRRIAFLGDMLELGEEEASAHEAVVRRAPEVADLVVLVGERMARAARGLEYDRREDVLLRESSEAVVEEMSDGRLDIPKTGDMVLAKGSAMTRMERVIAALLSPEVDPEEVLVRQSPGWQEI